MRRAIADRLGHQQYARRGLLLDTPDRAVDVIDQLHLESVLGQVLPQQVLLRGTVFDAQHRACRFAIGR